MLSFHKLIVAGGRDFRDYATLSRKLQTIRLMIWDNCLADDLEIVSGTARGADQLGERWARENQVSLTQFPADWDRYGKSAGYRRNEQMAKYAHTLLAAWDGKSRGTGHMIDLAKEYGLGVMILKY